MPPENPETPAPAVVLEKSGPTTATAGSTVTYTFTATNTGNVTLSDVDLTDNKCEATLGRVDPNDGDTSFDPDDVWNYSCAMATTTAMTEACNTVTVNG